MSALFKALRSGLVLLKKKSSLPREGFYLLEEIMIRHRWYWWEAQRSIFWAFRKKTSYCNLNYYPTTSKLIDIRKLKSFPWIQTVDHHKANKIKIYSENLIKIFLNKISWQLMLWYPAFDLKSEWESSWNPQRGLWKSYAKMEQTLFYFITGIHLALPCWEDWRPVKQRCSRRPDSPFSALAGST